MESITEKLNLSKALTIQGWMSKIEMFCLAHFAKEAQVILEVGSYKGRSARCLADNTLGKVYCVDPWIKDYYRDNGDKHEGIFPNVFSEFKENLKDHITSGKVIPLLGDLDYYASDLPPIDFAFIDGDHRYEQVMNDIRNCKKLVKLGGIIAGHDYGHPHWPGVKLAVNEAFTNITLHESIWWVKNA